MLLHFFVASLLLLLLLLLLPPLPAATENRNTAQPRELQECLSQQQQAGISSGNTCRISGDSNKCLAGSTMTYAGTRRTLDATIVCPLDSVEQSGWIEGSQRGLCTCESRLLDENCAVAEEEMDCGCVVCPLGMTIGFAYSCTTEIVGPCKSFDCFGNCNQEYDPGNFVGDKETFPPAIADSNNSNNKSATQTITLPWCKPDPVPMNYTRRSIREGDTVFFLWSGEDHSVLYYPSGDCNDRTNKIFLGEAGPVEYTFTAQDVGKSMTFVCDVSNHCQAGQYIVFDVVGADEVVEHVLDTPCGPDRQGYIGGPKLISKGIAPTIPDWFPVEYDDEYDGSNDGSTPFLNSLATLIARLLG